MTPWQERPIEERNLFNPAFCALVLAAALREYEKESSTGIPYSLTLLVLPLALHLETRAFLLANTSGSLLRLLEQRPDLLVNFAGRARGLVPHAMEAFALLADTNSISVTDDGGLTLSQRKVSPRPLNTDEAESCRAAGTFIGRQFARIEDRITVYTSLGVRP